MRFICESTTEIPNPKPLPKEIYEAYMADTTNTELAVEVGKYAVEILRFRDYMYRKLGLNTNPTIRYDCGRWYVLGVKKTRYCTDGSLKLKYEDFHRGETLEEFTETSLGFVVGYNIEEDLRIHKQFATDNLYHEIDLNDNKIKKIEKETNKIFINIETITNLNIDNIRNDLK